MASQGIAERVGRRVAEAGGEDRVAIEVDAHGVADVRLARPDKLNAVDDAMFVAVATAGRELARERGLRAVVLSGEGRGFCAGLDTSSFARLAGAGRGDDGGGFRALDPAPGSPATRAQEFAWAWVELPVPVIAAVHGVCFGAGIQLALAADIRFAAPDARLSIMEMRWGLVPDVTGTQTLRRLLPLDVAKELAFTARIVSGAEAVDLGLVTHVADAPHEAATALAREIAGRSPDAVRAVKRLLQASASDDEAHGLAREAAEQRRLIGSRNQVEAVAANLEKRAPRFDDPA
ncbi:MAG: crotonase/enoyl-CoA hydratase family protein [Myxococcota bacterium]